MKIYKITLILFLTLLQWNIYANPPLSDFRAAEILKAYEASFFSIKDFQATFVWETGNLRRGIEKRGTVMYKKGMYMVDFGDEQIYCDKVQQWIFDKSRMQVLQRDYDPYNETSIEVIFKSYYNRGKARYDGEENIGGKMCYKISVSINDPSITYSQINLWINKKTMLLEKALLLDYDQITTSYTFENIITNYGYTDNDFRFNAARYPDVEVITE